MVYNNNVICIHWKTAYVKLLHLTPVLHTTAHTRPTMQSIPLVKCRTYTKVGQCSLIHNNHNAFPTSSFMQWPTTRLLHNKLICEHWAYLLLSLLLPWSWSVANKAKQILLMYVLQSGEKDWDPARIWIWVFWMPVKCFYQLSHWISGIWAEDGWYISIDPVQFSGWISLL